MGRKGKGKQTLAITVYTDEMIDISYPDSSEEEKFEFSLISDLEKVDYAVKTIGQKFKKITRVVLDDEYLEWLEENKLPNSEEIRSRYASQTTIEKAERLWIKNDMHVDVFPLLLPIVIFGGTIPINEMPIPSDLVERTKQFVASTYQISEKDVWVHSGITRSDIWDAEEDYRMFEFLDEYFKGEDVHYETPKVLLTQKEINVDMRFIRHTIPQKSNCILQRIKKGNGTVTIRKIF